VLDSNSVLLERDDFSVYLVYEILEEGNPGDTLRAELTMSEVKAT
jgi:hypothetical protein